MHFLLGKAVFEILHDGFFWYSSVVFCSWFVIFSHQLFSRPNRDVQHGGNPNARLCGRNALHLYRGASVHQENSEFIRQKWNNHKEEPKVCAQEFVCHSGVGPAAQYLRALVQSIQDFGSIHVAIQWCYCSCWYSREGITKSISLESFIICQSIVTLLFSAPIIF